MRTIITLGIAIAVLASLMSTSMVCGDHIQPRMKASALTYDELDQNQPVYVNGTIVPVGRISILGSPLTVLVAQSFIPTKEVLTRVELLMGKNVTASYPLVVGIRDNLTHPNLVQTQLTPDHFTSNLTWIEFNFDDLWVNPGQTYFIVAATRNATDNYYGWAASNHSDAYLKGVAYFSIDNGSSWLGSATTVQPQATAAIVTQRGADNGSFDMCFKTYGLRQTVLNLAFASGIFAPKITITNAGNITAYDIRHTVSIQGGLLKKVNVTGSGFLQAQLNATKSFKLYLGLLAGFGFINITMTVSATNAKPVTLTKDGFLLFFFVIIQ
ncbi:MAG TPA: hypothetical protein VMT57_01330 [Candidatus Thermoplasmatota archaeon]|nr:hypothetical protein [Candidatus Thermoplasmatota archaeon]